MAAPTEIRQRAIALLEQLPGDSLVRAVAFLEALSQESSPQAEAPLLAAEEAALLAVIQRRPSPEDQERLDYLRQRSEQEIITDTEHQELLNYIERIEQQDAERAEALIKLAQLRQVDLNVLMEEFAPTHSSVA